MAFISRANRTRQYPFSYSRSYSQQPRLSDTIMGLQREIRKLVLQQANLSQKLDQILSEVMDGDETYDLTKESYMQAKPLYAKGNQCLEEKSTQEASSVLDI